MKVVAVVFITMLTPILAVIGAAILALNGKDGWGWFLIVAFAIAGSAHVKVD